MEAKILEVPSTPLDFLIRFAARSFQIRASNGAHFETETFPAKMTISSCDRLFLYE